MKNYIIPFTLLALLVMTFLSCEETGLTKDDSSKTSSSYRIGSVQFYDADGNKAYRTEYSYDSESRIDVYTIYDSNDEEYMKRSYTYDDASGRMASITFSHNLGDQWNVNEYSYEYYDSDDPYTDVTVKYQAHNEDSATKEYRYTYTDSTDQLLYRYHYDGGYPPDSDLTYHWSEEGNLKSVDEDDYDGTDVDDYITYDYNEDGTIDKKVKGSTVIAYTYDDAGRLSGYKKFVDNGLTKDGSAEITWEEGESASDPQNIQNNIAYQYYIELFNRFLD